MRQSPIRHPQYPEEDSSDEMNDGKILLSNQSNPVIEKGTLDHWRQNDEQMFSNLGSHRQNQDIVKEIEEAIQAEKVPQSGIRFRLDLSQEKMNSKRSQYDYEEYEDTARLRQGLETPKKIHLADN